MTCAENVSASFCVTDNPEQDFTFSYQHSPTFSRFSQMKVVGQELSLGICYVLPSIPRVSRGTGCLCVCPPRKNGKPCDAAFPIRPFCEEPGSWKSEPLSRGILVYFLSLCKCNCVDVINALETRQLALKCFCRWKDSLQTVVQVWNTAI